MQIQQGDPPYLRRKKSLILHYFIWLSTSPHSSLNKLALFSSSIVRNKKEAYPRLGINPNNSFLYLFALHKDTKKQGSLSPPRNQSHQCFLIFLYPTQRSLYYQGSRMHDIFPILGAWENPFLWLSRFTIFKSLNGLVVCSL